MKGWHFLPDDKRLRFGGHQKVKVGEWIKAEGDLEMCKNGMHASKLLIDALRYSPGSRICRVELRGDLQHQDDKSVGRERRVLWWIDGKDVLRDFARRCALDVIHLWDAPDVVVQYLETGDESIRAAAAAAAAAAASAAAASAAYAAAYAADAYAAYAASDAAAYAAARAAAASAAYAAAYAADAARAAAADAADDAARATQDRRLTSMVVAAHRRQA